MFRCQRCGTDLRIGGRGRPPRYCSPACKQATYRARRLPAQLADGRRWVRAAGKRPVTTSGAPASSTDPSTWSTLAQVRRSTAGDGLGVMLGAGLGCYDLDDVTDDQVRAFLATIPEPVIFLERSQSGRGAHIFIKALEATGWRRTINGVRVERYTRARFIRTTLDRMTL